MAPIVDGNYDQELSLTCIVSTSLKTKLDHELADGITNAIVDNVQCIAPHNPDIPLDLNMLEIMTCNVTFRYERTEVKSGFFYSCADKRE